MPNDSRAFYEEIGRPSLNKHEPAPVRPEGGINVWPDVLVHLAESLPPHGPELRRKLAFDMAERDALGRAKHGGPLVPGDGRDSLIDLYQETLDAVVYARKGYRESVGVNAARELLFAELFRTNLAAAARIRRLLIQEGR